MEAFTVRDLRERTGELIRGAEEGHLAIVTKHGTPVFVAVPFDDILLERGVRVALAIKLFDENVISQGQAAKMAGLSLSEFFEACAAQNVPVVRYSSEELTKELEVMDELHHRG